MSRTIDLDSNATTPMHPEVISVMLETMESTWGNPASNNSLGWAANRKVETARAQVAELIGAAQEEIVFTSGATESINLAIQGIVQASNLRSPHIVTTNTEHKAVLETIRHLVDAGLAEATVIPANRYGVITKEAVANALRDNTVLVCVIHGNNEIGSLNPIAEIGALLSMHQACFFVDAAQTLGYFHVSVDSCHIDAMCISGHKHHGPKGVGALHIRKHSQGKYLPINPIVYGGGQERGLRPGTMNVPAIVGFGKAAEMCSKQANGRYEITRKLADAFYERLKSAVPTAVRNGHPSQRLPGLLNITLPSIEYRELRVRLDPKQPTDDSVRICFSHGSACSESSEPSHVLQAIGLSQAEAACTFRVGINSLTPQEDVHLAADRFVDVILRLK